MGKSRLEARWSELVQIASGKNDAVSRLLYIKCQLESCETIPEILFEEIREKYFEVGGRLHDIKTHFMPK
jgi:hypothetical protein